MQEGRRDLLAQDELIRLIAQAGPAYVTQRDISPDAADDVVQNTLTDFVRTYGKSGDRLHHRSLAWTMLANSVKKWKRSTVRQAAREAVAARRRSGIEVAADWHMAEDESKSRIREAVNILVRALRGADAREVEAILRRGGEFGSCRGKTYYHRFASRARTRLTPLHVNWLASLLAIDRWPVERYPMSAEHRRVKELITAAWRAGRPAWSAGAALLHGTPAPMPYRRYLRAQAQLMEYCSMEEDQRRPQSKMVDDAINWFGDCFVEAEESDPRFARVCAREYGYWNYLAAQGLSSDTSGGLVGQRLTILGQRYPMFGASAGLAMFRVSIRFQDHPRSLAIMLELAAEMVPGLVTEQQMDQLYPSQ